MSGTTFIKGDIMSSIPQVTFSLMPASFSPESAGEQLLQGLLNGNIDENGALLLIKSGVAVNAKCKDGWTALHYAVRNGFERVVQLLIENGADVNAKNNNGATALHYAASKGFEGVVKLLIEKEADVNAKSNNGATALHCAAEQGFENIVKILKEREEVASSLPVGETPTSESYAVYIEGVLFLSFAFLSALVSFWFLLGVAAVALEILYRLSVESSLDMV